MFAAHCPTSGRRVLLGLGHITAIRNTDDGIRVEYRCTCGGQGSYLTGRRPAAIQPAAAEVATATTTAAVAA